MLYAHPIGPNPQEANPCWTPYTESLRTQGQGVSLTLEICRRRSYTDYRTVPNHLARSSTWPGLQPDHQQIIEFRQSPGYSPNQTQSTGRGLGREAKGAVWMGFWWVGNGGRFCFVLVPTFRIFVAVSVWESWSGNKVWSAFETSCEHQIREVPMLAWCWSKLYVYGSEVKDTFVLRVVWHPVPHDFEFRWRDILKEVSEEDSRTRTYLRRGRLLTRWWSWRIRIAFAERLAEFRFSPKITVVSGIFQKSFGAGWCRLVGLLFGKICYSLAAQVLILMQEKTAR